MPVLSPASKFVGNSLLAGICFFAGFAAFRDAVSNVEEIASKRERRQASWDCIDDLDGVQPGDAGTGKLADALRGTGDGGLTLDNPEWEPPNTGLAGRSNTGPASDDPEG